MSSTLLEGFGAGLVREMSLAARVQAGLERLYGLDRVAAVSDYMQHATDGEREALLVRETDDGVEIALRVPMLRAREVPLEDASGLDPLCQLIEGVSHFVLLTERACTEGSVSQLELELQAEVDKYVVLGSSLRDFDWQQSARLRRRLYEDIVYEHAAGSERGERYRLANRVAAQYTHSLERRYLHERRYGELQHELRAFFHAPQGVKLQRVAA